LVCSELTITSASKALAQLGQPAAGGDGSGQRLEADEEVLALDGAQVGVALCGEGVHAVGEHLEGLFLDAQVGGGGERLGCHGGGLQIYGCSVKERAVLLVVR
jgi:hypothetical protein